MDLEKSKDYVVSSVVRRVIIIAFLAVLAILLAASTIIFTTFYWLTGSAAGAGAIIAGIWAIIVGITWGIRRARGSEQGVWFPIVSFIVAAATLGVGWVLYLVLPDSRHYTLDLWESVPVVANQLYRNAAADRESRGTVLKRTARSNMSTPEKLESTKRSS